MNKKVSIIIPCYRCGDTLLRAVDSALKQTYKDIEILVIDDKCPDNSIEKISHLLTECSIFRLVRHKENLGVAQARNSGIKAAKGRYIAFLDSDDYWLPNKLEEQMKLLEQGKRVVYSSYYREKNGRRKLVKVSGSINFSTLLKGNVIGNLTGIYDAEFVGKVLQKTIGHEDYLMWLEIVRKAGRAYAVDKALAVYTVTENSLSSNKWKALLWQWNIYRRELQLSLSKSLYLFFSYITKAILKGR